MNPLLARVLRPYLMAPAGEGGDGGGGPAATPPPAPPADDDTKGKALSGPEARLAAMRQIATKNLERDVAEHKDNGLEIEGLGEEHLHPEEHHDDEPAGTPPPTPEPTQQPRRAAKTPPPPAPPPSGDVDQVSLQLDTSQPVDLESLDDVVVRVKIDGKVVEKPMRELRQNVQLDGAAQQRLEVATRLMQQANDLAARAQAPTPPAPGATPPPVGNDGKKKEEDSASVADLATRLTQSLYEGDEKKTQALMTEALQTLSGKTGSSIDATALAGQVVSTVRQQLSNEEALAKFTADYKDIVADPYLAGIADAELARVAKEKPELSFEAQLAEAGKATQDWMKARGLKPATEPAPPTNRERKLTDKKREIDNVSGVSSKAGAPAAPEPPSTSDVIAKMRQGRAVQGARA